MAHPIETEPQWERTRSWHFQEKNRRKEHHLGMMVRIKIRQKHRPNCEYCIGNKTAWLKRHLALPTHKHIPSAYG
jgi:hypothetical protein